MGMLFKTPDTVDVINELNTAFSDDRIDELYLDDAVITWFGDNFSPGSKKLWQISSHLGIWPKSGDRGKGRWFVFLKKLDARKKAGDPPKAEDKIKARILEVLTGLKNGTAGTPTSIVFDTIEQTNQDADYSDAGGVRYITLYTARHPISAKPDPTEDP